MGYDKQPSATGIDWAQDAAVGEEVKKGEKVSQPEDMEVDYAAYCAAFLFSVLLVIQNTRTQTYILLSKPIFFPIGVILLY